MADSNSFLPVTDKPIIGISGSAADSKSVTAMMVMVRSLGAEPMLLANHDARIRDAGGLEEAVTQDLNMVDAVLVMGNNADIDPAKYGQQPHEKTKIETDDARAAYEEAIIQKSLEEKVPLLGICGGHQRINVLAGGTLNQHVPDEVGDDHHMQGSVPGYIPVQYVNIEEGSKLSKIAGEIGGLYTPTHEKLPPNVVMENSFHHQAVDKVGAGFVVSAKSSDDVIEAIEADPNGVFKDQFVIGVQWHPEFGASPLGPKLVGEVIEAAKAYRKEKPRTQFVDVLAETLQSSMNKITEPETIGSELVRPVYGSFTEKYVKELQQKQQRGGAEFNLTP